MEEGEDCGSGKVVGVEKGAVMGRQSRRAMGEEAGERSAIERN